MGSEHGLLLSWAQVMPQQPITTFAVRLSDALVRDPRRIVRADPNTGQLTGYSPAGSFLL